MKYSKVEKKLIFTEKEVEYIEDGKKHILAKEKLGNLKTNHIMNIMLYLSTGRKFTRVDNETYQFYGNTPKLGKIKNKDDSLDGFILVCTEIYYYLSDVRNHRDHIHGGIVNDVIIYNTYANNKEDEIVIDIDACEYLLSLAKYVVGNMTKLIDLISVPEVESLKREYRERKCGFNLLGSGKQERIVKMLHKFELGEAYSDKLENIGCYCDILTLLTNCGYSIIMNVKDDNVIFTEG